MKNSKKELKAVKAVTRHAMPKACKPMWQDADKAFRLAVSVPPAPRATMEYEVAKPSGYTGI